MTYIFLDTDPILSQVHPRVFDPFDKSLLEKEHFVLVVVFCLYIYIMERVNKDGLMMLLNLMGWDKRPDKLYLEGFGLTRNKKAHPRNDEKDK